LRGRGDCGVENERGFFFGGIEICICSRFRLAHISESRWAGGDGVSGRGLISWRAVVCRCALTCGGKRGGRIGCRNWGVWGAEEVVETDWDEM
jgi:hypothetical protein